MMKVAAQCKTNYTVCCSLNLLSSECSLGSGWCSPGFPCPCSCTWHPQLSLLFAPWEGSKQASILLPFLCCWVTLCSVANPWVVCCMVTTQFEFRPEKLVFIGTNHLFCWGTVRWLWMVFNVVLFSSRGWAPLLPPGSAIQPALLNSVLLLERGKRSLKSWISECL